MENNEVVWYRANFEWTDGVSISSPLGSDEAEALKKFEDEKKSWCVAEYGSLEKVNLVKYVSMDGRKLATSRVIKRPWVSKINEQMFA